MGDAYTSVGYGTFEIGLGQRPAVLVVDLQVAFTDPKYALGGLSMIHRATERTAALLEVARSRNVPIAACYTAYNSQRDMPLWKIPAVRNEFIYGHPCTAMDPRISHPSQFEYCKNAPSMFFQTPLITFLVRQQVDTVIVSGCTTSGCVRATVVDAFSYGFRVQVAADCCGDADEGPHKDALRDVGRRYADVTEAVKMEEYLKAVTSG